MIAFAGGLIDPARWRTIQNLVCAASLPSTNAFARELVALYFDEGLDLPTTALVAESQPAAYGRTGRAWQAPHGRGVYFTLVRRSEDGEPLSLVPIAAARWAREVLAECTGAALALKWPNDLYVGRRKLAGVLAESSTQGDETYLALGVGINVLGSAADLRVPNATTLEDELGRPFAIVPLLQALLDRFDRELTAPRWSDEVRAWELASLHRPGDRMTVRRNGEGVTGEYLGLDASGFLRLKTEQGVAVIATGEVAEW